MSSKKLLVIFGATGQQGGSVLDHVLNDPELSSTYSIRAITRDTSSAACQKLSDSLSKAGRTDAVEIVQADLLDSSSLTPALAQAHTVFAITPPAFGPDAFNTEVNAGKALADATLRAGAEYIILSTLPDVTATSSGKYTKVTSFDAKAAVERHIRALCANPDTRLRASFFAPGSFMQNWHNRWIAPYDAATDTYTVARHTSPTSRLPLIDIVADAGKYVGAILADPDHHAGRTTCAATALYSMSDIVEHMSRATGKTVRYVQISTDEFRGNLLANKIPAGYVDILIDMMLYQQEFGYYGSDTEEKVRQAAEEARGQVTSFEEYLQRNPLTLGEA